jgi:hypothetical protein
MTSCFRGLSLAVLSVGLIGLVGCQEDNEAAVRANASGKSGAAEGAPPQAKSMEDYMKQQQNMGTGKGTGYAQQKKR